MQWLIFLQNTKKCKYHTISINLIPGILCVLDQISGIAFATFKARFISSSTSGLACYPVQKEEAKDSFQLTNHFLKFNSDCFYKTFQITLHSEVHV